MWRHIGQSVQGTNHTAHGTPCQDSFSTRLLGDGQDATLLACVADGAGYVRHSDIGSRLACQAIMESVAAHWTPDWTFAESPTEQVVQWCESARARISEHARLHERTLREYATTLCVAAISPRGSMFFQIGDGAIVVRKNDVLGVVFWPQSGEYVNTTNFLTSDDFRQHVQVFTTADAFLDLALLTDGIERLALRFDSLTPHPPFFQPLFQALRATSDVDGLGEALRQFLQSESVRNKSDDDKTLVLASRVVDEAGGAP